MFELKTNGIKSAIYKRAIENFNNKPFLYRAKISFITRWWFFKCDVGYYFKKLFKGIDNE